MATPKALFASSEDAEHAFYDALEHGDVDAVMDVWSEDDEVVCVHPGGQRLIGHAAVRAGWKAILAGGPLQAHPSDLHITAGPMIAVHSLIERLISVEQNRTRVARVFATNIYFKGPLGWRLVLHHASLTPPDQGTPDPGGPLVLH